MERCQPGGSGIEVVGDGLVELVLWNRIGVGEIELGHLIQKEVTLGRSPCGGHGRGPMWEVEVEQDPLNDEGIGEEGEDLHLSATTRAQQRQHLVNPVEEIAGLESISAGELRIGDRLVNDVPSSERDIAMVFQNYALYPHMTVYENMAFALRLRNEPKPEIDRRVREAGEILDIGSILDRKPRQLSGGQRQRVAVGRALVRHPRVFLFDEPLSNLDAKLRVQTRKEIARMHPQLDATMIYVTPDQVEAMTMGDRIVVMSAGLIRRSVPRSTSTRI